MNYKILLNEIADNYQRILGDNLTGIYVHGSIAFGCFNPMKSDIDFIVVVENSPPSSEKAALIQVLLKLSKYAPAKGFEMSVVLSEVCREFSYPTPFELHYSITHFQSCINNLNLFCDSMKGTDKDLAAHFTVIKKIGYVLTGKPIIEVFGEVPQQNYFDSIQTDIEHAEKEVVENPVYIILNLCRVIAYKNDGLLLSKEQGGLWGMKNIPSQYTELIAKALKNYRSDTKEAFDRVLSKRYCSYMTDRIFAK